MNALSHWISTNPINPKADREKFHVEPFKVCGEGNTGRRGTPIIFEGVKYSSWADASRETGLTKSAIRWKLQRI